MRNKLSYYDVLGVRRDASGEEIERAFRRRARERHPDHNPHDPAAAAELRQIVEAATTLRDPALRQAYDHTERAVWSAASVPPQPQPAARSFAWLAGDVEYQVVITLAQAAAGLTYQAQFHTAAGQPRIVVIAIPPGVLDGTRLCAPGQGGLSADQRSRGDFYLLVRIGPGSTHML